MVLIRDCWWLLGQYTYDVHEKCSIFETPHPPFVQLQQKFFHHMTLDVQLQTKPPSPSSPLQMITNQLKGNIILGWLLYVIRSFLQVDLTSFHLAEANLVSRAIFKNLKPLFCFPLIAKICARSKLCWSLTIYFSWLYILVCVVVWKYHEMFY